MDDIVDEVDEALHDGRQYVAYSVWGDDERCEVVGFSNICYGSDGQLMPDAVSEWRLHYVADETYTALERAMRLLGTTRFDTHGVAISVYLNGEPVVGSHV